MQPSVEVYSITKILRFGSLDGARTCKEMYIAEQIAITHFCYLNR